MAHYSIKVFWFFVLLCVCIANTGRFTTPQESAKERNSDPALKWIRHIRGWKIRYEL